ncbi:MAG: IPT/TIG domain-containing protein, partial [Betaproteobacteria bacterium]
MGAYDSATAQVQYIYDDVGNVVQIRRLAPGELALTQFFPVAGPPGLMVTLYGTGFNPVPTSNVVQFNGVAATVYSATTTQLVVIVPSGATTGPVSVSNGTSTVSSSRKFEVITTGPAITSFSPTIGGVGAAVAISGTGFDPLPINDRVSFGATTAAVASVTPTSIATSVPTGASTGKIGLAVFGVQVTSATEFFVTPATVNASNVVFAGRIVINGAALPVSIAPAGKQAMIVFDGSQGSVITLSLNSLVLGGGAMSYALYGVGNTQIASGSVSTAQPWALLPQLPATGTYTVVFTPSGANTSFSLRGETPAPLSIDGPGVVAAMNTSTQPARFGFSATAGQNLGLGFTGLSLSAGTYANVTVFKPDGSSWLTDYCYTNGNNCALNLSNSPVTGTYSVSVQPVGTATGSVQAWLSSDLAGTLTVGTAYTATTSRAGQNLRLALSGTVGASPALEFAGLTFNTGSPGLNVVLYKPDGTTWTSTIVTATGTTWTLPPFPVTGT